MPTTTEIDAGAGLRLRLTAYPGARTDARTALVLHGGGGVGTVAGIAEHLADGGWQVLLPTHPGWDGSTRPDHIDSIADLALAYLYLLAERDLHDVLVIGSSMGGWIGAQLALIDAGSRIGGLVLIDAVGVDIPGEPITDFFALDARGIAEHSYHDPDRFAVDPSTLTEERRAQMANNVAALRTYAGDPYMHDPRLALRLGRVQTPTAVIWGDSDRIVTPGYGKAYAELLPNARFVTVPEAGHLPQLEQPEATFAILDAALG